MRRGFFASSNRRVHLTMALVFMSSLLALIVFGSGLGQRPSNVFAQSSPAQQSAVNNASQASAVGSKNSQAPVKGMRNPFPYGTCTWWADQRYKQLYGYFVPWTTQANAWQWTARAQEFHWKVSSKPTLKAIINLQPGVEGAYGLGHVAFVEKVLANGHVIASNMSWGANPFAVTNVEFAPAAGVTFISF